MTESFNIHEYILEMTFLHKFSKAGKSKIQIATGLTIDDTLTD